MNVCTTMQLYNCYSLLTATTMLQSIKESHLYEEKGKKACQNSKCWKEKCPSSIHFPKNSHHMFYGMQLRRLLKLE